MKQKIYATDFNIVGYHSAIWPIIDVFIDNMMKSGLEYNRHFIYSMFHALDDPIDELDRAQLYWIVKYHIIPVDYECSLDYWREKIIPLIPLLPNDGSDRREYEAHEKKHIVDNY